jgi:hypothetical protein
MLPGTSCAPRTGETRRPGVFACHPPARVVNCRAGRQRRCAQAPPLGPVGGAVPRAPPHAPDARRAGRRRGGQESPAPLSGNPATLVLTAAGRPPLQPGLTHKDQGRENRHVFPLQVSDLLGGREGRQRPGRPVGRLPRLRRPPARPRYRWGRNAPRPPGGTRAGALGAGAGLRPAGRRLRGAGHRLGRLPRRDGGSGAAGAARGAGRGSLRPPGARGRARRGGPGARAMYGGGRRHGVRRTRELPAPSGADPDAGAVPKGDGRGGAERPRAGGLPLPGGTGGRHPRANRGAAGGRRGAVPQGRA